DPEDDSAGATTKHATAEGLSRPHTIKPPKFQSKLKQKISESKLLQILDHDLEASNQLDDDEELVIHCYRLSRGPPLKAAKAMGIKYSVQALTQTKEGGLVLHPKYFKYLQIHCPNFAMEACKVTTRMREIVLSSWEAIASGNTPGMKAKVAPGSSPVVFFYDYFYGSLFKTAPEVKPLFRASIIIQGKALISIVQTVTNEANVENAIEKVVDLAYRHNKYKVKMGYYNVLGNVLLTAVRECSGDGVWNAEMESAWRHVYAFMMTAMCPILYHGQQDPTDKEKQMAKTGKYLHSVTFRRPKEVQPATSVVPTGQCPVPGMTSINPGQCPVPH
ncbi:hypothetical protein DYB26_015814, partial [Aphanomyces astaci]